MPLVHGMEGISLEEQRIVRSGIRILAPGDEQVRELGGDRSVGGREAVRGGQRIQR